MFDNRVKDDHLTLGRIVIRDNLAGDPVAIRSILTDRAVVNIRGLRSYGGKQKQGCRAAVQQVVQDGNSDKSDTIAVGVKAML